MFFYRNRLDLNGFSGHDLPNPPYLPIFQSNLNPSGVVHGPREDVLHNTSRQLPRPLVPFQDNQDLGAFRDVAPDPPIRLHSPPIRALAPL